MIKKVASNANLPAEYSTSSGSSSTQEQEYHVEKFAILIHHADEYVLNADSRLIGDTHNNIQQLETLGYNVVSINPSKWKGMALSSTKEKELFIIQLLGLSNSDGLNKHNVDSREKDPTESILKNYKCTPFP